MPFFILFLFSFRLKWASRKVEAVMNKYDESTPYSIGQVHNLLVVFVTSVNFLFQN